MCLELQLHVCDHPAGQSRRDVQLWNPVCHNWGSLLLDHANCRISVHAGVSQTGSDIGL